MTAVKRRHDRRYSYEAQVILWDDTFVRYHEPHIGIAAVKVLEALGFEVALAKIGAAADDRRSVREISMPPQKLGKTQRQSSVHLLRLSTICHVRFCSSSRHAGRCSWKIIAS